MRFLFINSQREVYVCNYQDFLGRRFTRIGFECVPPTHKVLFDFRHLTTLEYHRQDLTTQDLIVIPVLAQVPLNYS